MKKTLLAVALAALVFLLFFLLNAAEDSARKIDGAAQGDVVFFEWDRPSLRGEVGLFSRTVEFDFSFLRNTPLRCAVEKARAFLSAKSYGNKNARMI